MLQIVKLYVTVKPYTELLGVTFRDTLDTNFKPPCTLILDQATKTGFSIWDSRKSLVMFGTINRGTDMSLTEFKHGLVEEIKSLKEEFNIEQLIYEEVYMEHLATYDNLLYIKHALEDLAYTEEELKVAGIESLKWKSILARPNKFVAENHKKEVLKYVEKAFPLLFTGVYAEQITEDMVDALGMGIALMLKRGRTIPIETMLKYNKKLPIHLLTLLDTVTPLEEQLSTTRKLRFKRAFLADGLFELDAKKNTNAHKGFRQFLTHRDGVAAILVTPGHREWGYHMLEQNLDLEDLQNEESAFWLLAIRKNKRY